MKSRYSVPALEKGLLIMEMLAESNQALGITDIFERCGLPKSTIFMILNTLEQLQYIQKFEENKYQLTFKLYNVGTIALGKLDIRDIALPVMQQIAEQLQFTVHLAILEQGKAVYIEKVNGPGFVQFSTKIGQTQFLHNSAVGKALAAFVPEKELTEMLQLHGMPLTTSNTLTTGKQFFEFLSSVREMGFAIEDEEGEVGVRCIAAPIYDHSGKVVASLSITATRNELPSIKFNEIGNIIKAKALLISEKKGFLGTPNLK